MLLSLLIAPTWAEANEAVGQVREGIAQFKGGDFKAAAEAFSAADEVMPNELKIAFDRGCAYAAGSEFDKAVEQFQKAAAAPDRKLAALAQYNLGGVAVARAKAKLGEKPEEAEGDARTEALELLAGAAKHYRDCLGIDAENADSRYNLETIRLWIKYIQDVWRERDRQKRREAMNLLEYLQWLETQQYEIRQSSKELGNAKPSPRQREAVRAVENAQRTLAEEIQPLKEKINSTLSSATQPPGKNVAASPSADVQKAIELLDRLADEARKSMDKAADSLAGGSLEESVNSQAQAVETIDQIFMAVAPYANLVERGIGRQEELINQSPGADKQEKSGEQSSSANRTPPKSTATFDGNEAAWNQRFVARYGRILSAKARRELEQLESMPVAKQEPPQQTATSTTPDANAVQAPDKDQQAADNQLTAEQQRRDLKEALQLGIQSAPKVEKLADDAALLLEEDKPVEALPKQQEALKLLKEMLPKQQQQDKDKQDQDKKDQDKKDQQKKEQKKQGQDKNRQDKQDQQDKNKDNQKQQEQQQQQQKKRDINKEQAEAVLRKAQQRQEQYRELEKKLEGYLYRPEKVEKDW